MSLPRNRVVAGTDRLWKRIGANKSYISRIENGLIAPTLSTVCGIINALGLRIEIVKPLG